MWHAERHVARLARDASLLGLGVLDRDAARRALAALAAPTSDGPDLKLRLEVRSRPGAAPTLRGLASPLGVDPPAWRAVTARVRHPGACDTSAAKSTDRRLYDAASVAARAAGADEALLLDADGFLVEGARTSVLVLRADGATLTPPLARGGQAGIGRAVLLAAIPELREADVDRAGLAAARAVAVVNAVRGVRPVIELDGRPVGDGRAGAWSERLARAFLAAC